MFMFSVAFESIIALALMLWSGAKIANSSNSSKTSSDFFFEYLILGL